MKLFIPMFLLCATAVAQSSIEGDSWKTVSQNGSGKISIVYFECPKLIEQVNGKPAGLCVDIMNDFAAFVKTKYGKTVEIKYMSKETDFGQFLKTVKSSSNVIGVSNTTISEQRKAEMKFSPFYLKTPLVVLTNKNAPAFTSLKELLDAGLSGQVEVETSYATFMEKIKSTERKSLVINKQSTTGAVLQELASSDKFFTVMDFTEYLGEVKNPNLKRQTIKLNNNVDLGFIMSKKSDWDNVFNEFLTDEYRNSLSYRKAVTTYLGANFMTLLKQ